MHTPSSLQRTRPTRYHHSRRRTLLHVRFPLISEQPPIVRLRLQAHLLITRAPFDSLATSLRLNRLPLLLRRPSPLIHGLVKHACAPPRRRFCLHFRPCPRDRHRFSLSHPLLRPYSTMSASTHDVLSNGDDRQPTVDAALGSSDTMSLDTYVFPQDRLKMTLSDPTKQPLVLVSCGSFSPPTNLHLRMFEEAADFCQFETNYEVVGGFFSPVGDAYKKAGLAPATHRINMTRIAVRDSSNWISVDPWEPLHKEYLPTVKVLDHFNHELNQVLGGIETPDGEKKSIHVALLAGADLIQTMSTPGLWAAEDLERILGHYGAFILERSGTDIDDALLTLQQYREKIWVIPQLIQNDVSSTKIRLFRKRGKSIRYYIPDQVVDYIYEHNLYVDDDKKQAEKGKDKISPDAQGSSTAATAS
ncbi:hypothetical protein PMIN06_010203 [Paraphaeosphaeria minitans]